MAIYYDFLAKMQNKSLFQFVFIPEHTLSPFVTRADL